MEPVQKLTPEQHKLVEDNVALARFLAYNRYEMAPTKLEFDELVALAYQGLINAAIRFDPTRPDIIPEDLENGKAFAGYARTKIIGAILDWQKRDADHVPRSYRTDYKILQRAGYPEKTKNYTDLAHSTGLTLDRIKLVVAAVERMPVSFDEMSSRADGPSEEILPSDHDVERSYVVESIGNAVSARVAKLPEIQQVVLALKYLMGYDLQLIAAELNISPALVREAHNAAIEAVYESMLVAVS